MGDKRHTPYQRHGMAIEEIADKKRPNREHGRTRTREAARNPQKVETKRRIHQENLVMQVATEMLRLKQIVVNEEQQVLKATAFMPEQLQVPSDSVYATLITLMNGGWAAAVPPTSTPINNEAVPTTSTPINIRKVQTHKGVTPFLCSLPSVHSIQGKSSTLKICFININN